MAYKRNLDYTSPVQYRQHKLNSHKMALVALILAVVVNFMLCLNVAGAQGAVGGAWIDMSHPFSNDTIYWPGNRRFSLTNVFKGHHPNGFWYVLFIFIAFETIYMSVVRVCKVGHAHSGTFCNLPQL